jgi:hypothetical protein
MDVAGTSGQNGMRQFGWVVFTVFLKHTGYTPMRLILCEDSAVRRGRVCMQVN